MITDADLEMAVPLPVPTADNPFTLGYRYTDTDTGPDCRVPLTEEDLLYPQEDDFVVNNEAHDTDLRYLLTTFRERVRGREGLRVFGDHMIDFGVPGLGILGPDVILFNGEPREWDRNNAVFPVKDMGARPLIAVELTSPSTRRNDLTKKPKLYFRANVPLYVLIDLPYGGGKRPSGITAFQAGPIGYEELPPEPDGRVWLEVVEVYLAVRDNRVACYDRAGALIPDLLEQRDAERQRADTAEAQRDAERARVAEAEAARDAERARADEYARKLADMEAELRRLRGDAN